MPYQPSRYDMFAHSTSGRIICVLTTNLILFECPSISNVDSNPIILSLKVTAKQKLMLRALGIANLGNTCFLNATLQVYDWNKQNPHNPRILLLKGSRHANLCIRRSVFCSLPVCDLSSSQRCTASTGESTRECIHQLLFNTKAASNPFATVPYVYPYAVYAPATDAFARYANWKSSQSILITRFESRTPRLSRRP